MPGSCEDVIVTPYGRRRCPSPFGIRVDVQERGVITTVYRCTFHQTHRGLPRCAGQAADGTLCESVAVQPTDNPQWCMPCNHRLLEIARFERERPRRRGDPEGTFTIGTTTPLHPLEPSYSSLDGSPIGDAIINEARDQEHHDENVWMGRFEEAEADDMPRLSLSETMTPFVASLVARLGGVQEVPAHTLAGMTLKFERFRNGVKFWIADREGRIVQTPTPVPAAAAAPAPTAPVIVEKIRDEEEFEMRKTLAKCEECGMQFDRTFKTSDGRDECPICELRRRDAGAVGVGQELRIKIRDLTMQNQGMLETNRSQAEKIARLEQMVQAQMDKVVKKQQEVVALKAELQIRADVSRRVDATNAASTAVAPTRQMTGLPDHAPTSSAERTRMIRDLLHANPGLGLANAARLVPMVRVVPPSVQAAAQIVTIREAVGVLAEARGGRVVSHSMQTRNENILDATTPREERHTFQIAIPLQSHGGTNR